MVPAALTPAQFSSYPPRAQQLALAHLASLRLLPLSFLPGLLRELIDFDDKFPAEQAEIVSQLAFLSALTPQHAAECFSAFSKIRLSSAQEKMDWVNQPVQFTEQLSAYLWSSHQMDAFRAAATAYGDRFRLAMPAIPPAVPRLGIAVIGQGVQSPASSLFRNLRPHGMYFSQVDPTDGLAHLLAAVTARAEAHPAPYAHWYVDGGAAVDHSPHLTCVSYAALAPARTTLLSRIQSEVSIPGMGPEELRNFLVRLSPRELGLHNDPVLDAFQLKLLTEGSGTQIFSTTFAQWTTREVLRRAAALTLLVRFAPRQRQRPMNELLSSEPADLQFDPAGSLVDADMAAYYHWINQQRLPGAAQSSFLVWFEGQNQALAIGPTVTRNTESKSPVNLTELLSHTANL